MHHAPITAAAEPNSLFALANEIVAASGEGAFGDAFTPAEWLNAAEWFLDTNGEDTDLQSQIDEQKLWDAYSEYADRAQFRMTPLDYDVWVERYADSYVPDRGAVA